MKKLLIAILLLGLVLAGCTETAKTAPGASTVFVPPGDIDGRGIYSLRNFVLVSATGGNFTTTTNTTSYTNLNTTNITVTKILFSTSSGISISSNGTCIFINGTVNSTKVC